MTRWLDDEAERIVAVIEGLASIYLFAAHEHNASEGKSYPIDVHGDVEQH